MIRKIIFTLFIILLLVVTPFALLQQIKNRPLSIIESLNLQDRLSIEGKTAVFRVNFLGCLPVGYAKIKNTEDQFYRNKKIFHITAIASVSGVISKLFNAKAQADSYMDKEKLHSLKFKETLILPDKPKEEKEVLYNQEKNVMELRGVERKILPDTQDPLSALIFIQRQPLKIGKEFDININTNQKNYRLYAKVIKREEYAIEDKKVGVWVMKGDIRRRDKSPRHSSTMTLWLLDNPSRIPLLVKATTNIVSITARLIDVE